MNNLVSQGHIVRNYDKDMTKLERRVLRMGEMVRSQLQRIKEGLDATTEPASDPSQEVLDADDNIDRLEIKADRTIIRILARRAPVGQDLRYLVASSRIVTELERMGDEATQIARALRDSSYRLGMLGDMDSNSEVRAMLSLLIDLCDRACSSFSEQNEITATELLYGSLKEGGEISTRITRMQKLLLSNASQVADAITLTLALRSLERAVRYVANICEHVIYLVSARDVRHPKLEQFDK